MESLKVLGDIKISTGNDDDYLQFFRSALADPPSQVFGSVSINTGQGADQVRFDGSIGRTFVGGILDVDLGNFADSIFGAVDVDGSAFLSGGQGTDSCSGLSIKASELIKIGFEL